MLNDKELLHQAVSLLNLIDDESICDASHHSLKDRHELGEACPILERHKNLFEAIKARLAQPEPVMWQNAALRLGEDLSTVCPDGYYNMTAKQWLDWALSATTNIQFDYMQLGACEEKSRKDYIGLILGVRVDNASVIIKTKNKDNAKYLCNKLLNEKENDYYPAPQKKEWISLTNDELTEMRSKVQKYTPIDSIQYGLTIQCAMEEKLREKNGMD